MSVPTDEWSEVSERNARAAGEKLAEALVSLLDNDFDGARQFAQEAVNRLSAAKAFAYVHRVQQRTEEGES